MSTRQKRGNQLNIRALGVHGYVQMATQAQAISGTGVPLTEGGCVRRRELVTATAKSRATQQSDSLLLGWEERKELGVGDEGATVLSSSQSCLKSVQSGSGVATFQTGSRLDIVIQNRRLSRNGRRLDLLTDTGDGSRDGYL